jgi:hypothetical protein
VVSETARRPKLKDGTRNELERALTDQWTPLPPILISGGEPNIGNH